MEMEQLKYPIGRFMAPDQITPEDRNGFIHDLEILPQQVNHAVKNLNDDQLDTPYRPEGWTNRQVVHHLPDSHLNSYIRFKWTLTEDQPLIKAYNEKEWALLPDGQQAPISISLTLLESIHTRWVWFLNKIEDDQWKKCFEHPETGKLVPLDVNLSLYSWHGKHHLAHIRALISRKNW
jgi:hypothetical protein